VTGVPAIAVCIGFTSGGPPLAMQIAGRPFEETTVLRVAHAYERATSWRSRQARPVMARRPESGGEAIPERPENAPVRHRIAAPNRIDSEAA